jgi:hypothetical protein
MGSSGATDGLLQGCFFFQGKKAVEVVDQDQSVRQLHHAFGVFDAGYDIARLDDLQRGILEHARHLVGHEGNRPSRRAGDDEPVGERKVPLGQTKPPAQVEHGDDPSPHVDHAENDGRRPRKGRDLHHVHDALHRGQRQAVALIAQGEYNDPAWGAGGLWRAIVQSGVEENVHG